VSDYIKNGTPVGGASLSDATPAALGTAAAGVSTSASRADHVHAAPAAAGITDASATGISLVTAASAAAARTAIGVAASSGGTLAARPASPALGDVYLVSDADPTDPGTLYVCTTAGVWTRIPAGRVATNVWPTVAALHHWRLDDVPGGSAPLSDLGSGAVALTEVGSSWVRGSEATPYGMRQASAIAGDALTATIAGGGLTRAAGWSMAATVAAYTAAGPAVYSRIFGAYLSNSDYVIATYYSPTTQFYAQTKAATVGTDSAGSAAVGLGVAHRIALVASAASNDVTLYVDGIATAAPIGGSARATLTTVKILDSTSGVEVREVKVWGSPLTAAQVRADYLRARPGMAR